MGHAPFSVQARAISAVSRAVKSISEKNNYSCLILSAAASAWSNGEDLDELVTLYKGHAGAKSIGFKHIPTVVWAFLPSSVQQRIRVKKLSAFLFALLNDEVVL